MNSVVIVTKNSQEYLRDCLSSVAGFADELVIFDLGSDDETIKIANEFSAKIYHHESVPYVEQVRSKSIAQAKGDWVLVLDPDERATPGLLAELRKTGTYTAVNIPRKNVFFGEWVRHSNFWPDRQIRFFNKSKITWPNRLHAYPEVKGNILNLKDSPQLAIEHYGYRTWDEFFERQNRYSTAAAGNLKSQGEEFFWWQLFWQPAREFLVRYIKHAGFLDGMMGIGLVLGLVIFQLSVQIKLWEKSHIAS